MFLVIGVSMARRRDAARGEAAGGTRPTDDLEADLLRVLSYYDAVMRDHGRLLLVLMTEAARNPELGEIVREPMGVQAELRQMIEHHQQAGRLVVEPPGIALQALIGPLLARTIARMLEPDAGLGAASVEEMLERFLRGHRAAR